MAARNRTSTLTINAAFLQEIKEVNEDLWRELEEVRGICGTEADVRGHARQLPDTLAQLRDQLAMHFALEEAYGYFEDPVAVAPHLTATACALRDEHSSLYSSVCEVLEFVESEFYAGHLPTSAKQVVERFQAFYDQLQTHEAKENELILKAYDDDIGVGD